MTAPGLEANGNDNVLASMMVKVSTYPLYPVGVTPVMIDSDFTVSPCAGDVTVTTPPLQVIAVIVRILCPPIGDSHPALLA